MLSVGTLISSRSRKWYTLVAVVVCLGITAVTLLVGQSITLRPTLASTSSPQLDALQSLLSARLQVAQPTRYASLGGLRSQLSTSMRPSPASQPSVQIVAARSNEDTSWLDVYLSYIPHVVYQIADVHAVHTTLLNKGNEAGAYLEYILDNYNSLPDVVLFCHGSGYVCLQTLLAGASAALIQSSCRFLHDSARDSARLAEISCKCCMLQEWVAPQRQGSHHPDPQVG